MISNKLASSTLALFLSCGFGISSVSAADQAAGSTAVSNESGAIEEVIVTAQRREQSLKDVPLAVTAISAEDILRRNFTGPEQLPLLVPSLQLTSFQASPGATNFSVRGVGTASFSHLIEPSVATVIDGVVMGRPEMGVMEFSDLERVEVLEGPQGTLFGKNSSAGLVNIVTARPKLGVTEFQGRVSYADVNGAGSDGDSRVSLLANLPIGETAAARVSAYYTNLDGLVENTLSNAGEFGHEQYGIRGKLLFQPNDRLSVYFSGDYSDSHGMGSGVFVARSNGPGSSFTELDAEAGVTPSPNNLFQSSDADTDLDFQVGGGQVELNYELTNGLMLTNILAYRSYRSHHTIDFDLRQIDIVNLSAASFDFDQVTEELRVASPANEDYDYQFGVFYYTANSDRHDLLQGQLGLGTPAPPAVAWIGINSDNNLDTDSYAIYGQGSRRIGDKFRVTAGARFTKDKLALMGTHNQDGYIFTISGDPGTQTYTPSTDESDVSWRLSGQYEMTSDVTSYVTVARGYKGPGYNLSWSGIPGALPVGPEHSMDYEIGIKSTFAHWMLNATAYFETFNDFQVQAFRPGPTPGSGSFIIENAAKAEAKGIEAQIAYRGTNGFSLNGGFNYNDATYKTFVGSTCYPGETEEQGCVGGVADASGNQIANAPKFTLTVGGDYEWSLSSALKGFVHADVFTRTSVNFDPGEDPNSHQGGYGITNASFAIGDANDRWKATLYCENCFDKRYVTFIQATPVGGPGDYNQTFALDSFRSVGIALDVKF